MLRKDKVKVIFLILFLAASALLLGGDSKVKAFSVGPNPGHTGAPAELTCAVSDCHGGTPNSGPGQFTITAPSSYEPGKTYEITVTHSTNDSTRRRWGFQLTALGPNNARAGTLQSTGGSTQVLEGGPGGNRQYIEHTQPGTFAGQRNGASWRFNWTAPDSDIGPVTLYAAGNQANNSGDESGDQIYKTSVIISPAAAPITGPPQILNASVSGKKLLVSGNNFDDGATLYMCSSCATPATEGDKVKKVSNDSDTPRQLLVAKKAGKDIDRGSTVKLQVKNPDGSTSDAFSFTRQ